MSDFSCPVVRIASVHRVPDADQIEVARVFEIEVIVSAGLFHPGDLAIYLPPDALLPADLAASLKGRAKLFGERRNRVRPYRLHGAFSEGLLLGPLRQGKVGEDAAPMLGIVKYQQPVPAAWRGKCVHLPGFTIGYDIRSGRRYSGIFHPGEAVEISEKLHGTMCAAAYFPGLHHSDLPDGDTLIYSKGLGETGHVLKDDSEHNLYLRIAAQADLRARLKAAFNGRPVTVFGEIYGAAVQDLDYGLTAPAFALFDIYLGLPGTGHWLSRREFNHIAGEIAPAVPTLHGGPLRAGIVQQMTAGPSVAGNMAHIREGVVIRPLKERTDPRIGRVVLKYISKEYLTRANGTEFQ